MVPCFVSIFPYTCISNKMQRYTVYLYLETALRVSGGTSTHHQERIQLSTASGICHTVTAICRYRGRVGTGLSVLWVAYAVGRGRPGPDRPRPTTLLPPRSYDKPEAAAATDSLLMMGKRMPETC
jgi:hypothetical protein